MRVRRGVFSAPFIATAVLAVAMAAAVTAAVMARTHRHAALTAALERVLAAAPPPSVSKDTWPAVRAFYAQRDGSLAWVRGQAPSGASATAIRVLQSSRDHGLVPRDDERMAAAREALARATVRGADHDATLAAFDVELTAALLTLGRDVAVGRTSPASLDSRWKARRRVPDLAATLAAAYGSGLTSWLDTVRPQHPQYAALRRALASLYDDLESGEAPEATADRIKIVSANLERWRWMPDSLGNRYLFVNIPSFMLVAREADKPVLTMKVVTGKPDTSTPVFSSEMTTLVFSPYWNIPESIAENETMVAANRDPEYLERNHIEQIESGNGDVRLRQKPGPGNALGFVKFLFPNPYNVYLHDTPSDNLFAKTVRALSHGCVRVEQPEALARYVLRGDAAWDDHRIELAMHDGTESHVKLPAPIPVHIAYFTAWVDDAGTLVFGPDVYGYDRKAKN